MKIKIFTSLSLSILLSLSASVSFANPTLKGGVQTEEERLRQQGLNRNEINTSGPDPFGSDPMNQGEMLAPPPGSFEVEKTLPQAPVKPLRGNTEEQGNGGNLREMPPMEDTNPQNAPPSPFQKPLQSQAEVQQPPQANDPDKSAEMKLLWDAWHKRVAESIFTRFNGLAQFAFAHSPPLLCQVSYVVARDGRIGNVRLLQKSSSVQYNAMLVGVVSSMNNNPVLEFPPNSKRQFVEKTGTFTWNYGQHGYKYTTNDQETIQMKGQGGQTQQMQSQQMQQPMQQQMQPQYQQQQPMQQMQQQYQPRQQMGQMPMQNMQQGMPMQQQGQMPSMQQMQQMFQQMMH